MVENTALLKQVASANDKYAQSLIEKGKRGIKLRQEDLVFLTEYKQQRNTQITVNELIRKGKAGEELTQNEIQVLKDYRTNRAGPSKPKQDFSSIKDPEMLAGIQAVAQSGARKLTAQDKLFAKKLGKIGPISKIDLTEEGDTPELRLALDVYGADNVTIDEDGEITVKPKGQTEFLRLPSEGGLSTLGRTVKTGLATLVGESIGSPGGVLGVAAGAGIAGGLTERDNVKKAINEAEKLGIVLPDERKVFDGAVMTATITGGSLGAIFGGGVPVLKGMSKAGSFKAIPSAIRSENKTIAQESVNLLRRFGVRGKDIQKNKATLGAEQMSDELLAELSGVEPGSGGTVFREVLDNFVSRVNSESDNLFNQAAINTEKRLAEGKPVATANISELYNAFRDKVLKEASVNDRPEILSFLDELQNELNFTKQQIASGQLPVKGAASRQFASNVVEQVPTDATIFGVGGFSDTVSQRITLDFDPSKFTARDFNKTKNFIKDALTNLDNPKYILDKNSKKNITQFLKALEKPFTTTADEASEIALINGIKPNELIAENPLLQVKIEMPKNASDFSKVVQGYKVRADGFKKAPIELRKVTQNAPTDNALEESLFKMDFSIAKQARGLVDEFASPENKQVFTTSIKGNLLNPSSSAGKKQIVRRTRPDVSQEVKDRAVMTNDELKAFQAEGGKPTASEFGGAGFGESVVFTADETLGNPTITQLQGNRASNILSGRGSTPSALLGESAEETLSQSQKLSGLQSASGIPQSAVDIGKTTDNALQQSKKGNLISALGDLLGAGARPVARIGADVIEGISSFSPAATVPNIGGYAVRNETLDNLLGRNKRR